MNRSKRQGGRCSRPLALLIIMLAGIATASAMSPFAECSVSEATFNSDRRYMTEPSPTHLSLMGARYVDLLRAERGLACTGVPLVAFDGRHYQAAAPYDDPGLYLFAPELARLLNIGIGAATDALVLAAILLGSILGLSGLLLTVRTTVGRRIGIIAILLLTILELRASQVYALSATVTVAALPWIVFFIPRKKLTAIMPAFFLLLGMAADTANVIRTNAGTGILIFTVLAVAGAYQLKAAGRIALVLALLLGMAASTTLFQNIYHRRDAFLQQQMLTTPRRTHVFWHSIYIGLGWVKNPEVPAYKDEAGFGKAREVQPGIDPFSRDYEKVLKQQVFSLIRRHPLIIFENITIKLAVVMIFCFAAGNIGLYAARLAPKPILLEAAFWLVIGFGFLPGILVVPNLRYILLGIVFTVFYAIYSLEYAAGLESLHARLRWVRRLVLAEPRRIQSAVAS